MFTKSETPAQAGVRSNCVDIRAAVSEYRSAGFAVCRVRAGAKVPADRGWGLRSLEAVDFHDADNVGIILGSISDGNRPDLALVCADFDSEEALAIAPQHFAATEMMDGRPSKPCSHWFYLVPVASIPPEEVSRARQAVESARQRGCCPGPRKRQFRDGKKVHFDFLGAGTQVAAPPTHHPSGERRSWNGGERGPPTIIEFGLLLTSRESLARALGCAIPGQHSKRTRDHRDSVTVATGMRTLPQSPIDPTRVALYGAAERRESVKIDGVWWTHAQRVRVATEDLRRRVQRIDQLPRSGHGGHATLMAILRRVVNDYLVRVPDQVRRLVRDLLNSALRRASVKTNDATTYEPWSEADFEHKLRDALSGHHEDYPPGCALISHPEGRRSPQTKWTDPSSLVTNFTTQHTVIVVKGRWYQFDGVVYAHKTEEEVKDQLCSLAEAERDAEQGGRKSQRFRPVTQTLVSNACAVLRSRVRAGGDLHLETWMPTGSGRRLLAVGNGLLDLDSVGLNGAGEFDPRSARVLDNTPDWFSLVRLPADFDPTAPTPDPLLRYLDRVTGGDGDLAWVLQELAGACLDPTLALKFFAILLGDGDNGKSAYLTILRSLLGPGTVAAVDLRELATGRFASSGLRGKLANLIGDQPYFESACEAKLKALTGGDLITFEEKFQNAVTDTNTAKLILSCNVVPKFADPTNAVWNRLVLVPFGATIEAHERDPALLTTTFWSAHSPGLLNWALTGLARLKTVGEFTRSEASEVARERHRAASDPVRDFLLKGYRFTGLEQDFQPTTCLYTEYLAWCEGTAFVQPVSNCRFGGQVRRLFPRAVSATRRLPGGVVRAWHGIARAR